MNVEKHYLLRILDWIAGLTLVWAVTTVISQAARIPKEQFILKAGDPICTSYFYLKGHWHCSESLEAVSVNFYPTLVALMGATVSTLWFTYGPGYKSKVPLFLVATFVLSGIVIHRIVPVTNGDATSSFLIGAVFPALALIALFIWGRPVDLK